ncbi:MAG TPA: bifunctional phosphoribosyl-AMP cyclohydrolase/phosphoribosyl-ATP diphosphatase HisIE, partial [Pyrinomonadaceae bacterium]|nr:bifunctional phosphoribosyl-AMP cyclohydrolase/phosphoribosyl-ATP diphosphatase HisIE [Pyrinomonadaceae bacterium]
VTFFSRLKQRLWVKGETSGNFLDVVSITPDCDNDTLLIKVKPKGPTCHKGSDTCFGETNVNDPITFLNDLGRVIEDRRINPTEESYVSLLFEKGLNKIAQKVGEEAIETVIAAKDDDVESFNNEAADLVFHLMILLKARNSSFSEVVNVLRDRSKKA